MVTSRLRSTRSLAARRGLCGLGLLVLVTVATGAPERRVLAETTGGAGDFRLDVHTCSPRYDGDHPQTRDPVQISFGVRKWSTWLGFEIPLDSAWIVSLDNPDRDRGAGQWDTYRFNLPSRDLTDVSNIRVDKSGDDRWCFDDLRLYRGDDLVFDWNASVVQPRGSYKPEHPTTGPILLDGQERDAPASFARFTNASTSYASSTGWNPRLQLRSCTTGAQGTRDSVYIEVTHDGLTDAVEVPSGALAAPGAEFVLPFTHFAPLSRVERVSVRTSGTDALCIDWVRIVEDWPVVIGMPIATAWEDVTNREVDASKPYHYYSSYQRCTGSRCDLRARMGFDLHWKARNVPCAAGTASTSSDDNCNGIDDDCDGRIDEDFVGALRRCGRGSCARTLQDRCESGLVVAPACDAMLGASAEVCDSRDNDCNGLADDNLAASYTCGFGVCAEPAVRSCSGGQWTVSCAPKTCATLGCGEDAACRVDEGGLCTRDAECDPGLVCAVEGACRRPQCFNGVKDPTESKIDCGGPCAPCDETACLSACGVGERVAPPALATLNFSKGTFTREGPATNETQEGKVEQARPHELRWVDRGGRRLALFEGAGTNLLQQSEAWDRAPWVAPPSAAVSVTADEGDAPDGTKSAELMAFASGLGRGPMQTVAIAGTRATFSVFASAGPTGTSGAAARARVFALGAGDSVLGTQSYSLAREPLRFDLPFATTAGSHASVLVSHMAGFPNEQTSKLTSGDYYVWGAQLEEQPFPTSYISATTDASALRAADDLRIPAHDVPAWFGTGMFQVDVAPQYSCDEMVPELQYTLFSFGKGTDASLVRTDGFARLRVRVAYRIVHSRPLVWSRGAILTLTFDNAGDKITVAGVGTGNGEQSVPGLDFRNSGGRELRVGGIPGGTNEAFAAIGEPRQVSAGSVGCTPDPDCPVCGDGIVDTARGEECEPSLDAYCSRDCVSTPFVDRCPNCKPGQVCPDAPNGAAFGLDPGDFICWPAGGHCPRECGSGYDGPCGKCNTVPDCSGAACGGLTLDGAGNVCKHVCAAGQLGCLLDSDCEQGTHCMEAEGGGSECSAPLSTIDVTRRYRAPRSMPDGSACYLGPLCETCSDVCASGVCNDIGECLAQKPQCVDACATGCDAQGQCLAEIADAWPDDDRVLPSDAVAPPDGALSVSDSGVASYVIPLTLPDGPSGHQPELRFVYTSTAGDGALGRGWSLSGLSVISVCEASPRVTPTYQGGPGLCLDGQPLQVKGQRADVTYFTGLYEGGYVVRGQYRLWEADSSAHIPFPSVSDLGAKAWVPGREFTVHHEDGRTLYYGHATDDEFLLLGGGDPAMGPSSIRQWLLRRVTDRFGNTIDYRYQKAGVMMRAPALYDPKAQDYRSHADGQPVSQRADSEAILRWIGYNGGNAEVAFHYVGDGEQRSCSDAMDPHCELATNLQLGRFHGGPLGRLMVLRRVDVKVASHRVRSYAMRYTTAPKGGVRLLSTLQECGYAQEQRSCAPPLRFDYGDPSKTDKDENAEPLLVGAKHLYTANSTEVFRHYAQPYNLVFDADGDGVDDYVSFDENGGLWMASGGDESKLRQVVDSGQFPTYFNYKPREQSRGILAKIGLNALTLGGAHAMGWGDNEDGSLMPLEFGVDKADINRDGLTDLVMWGLDPTQHIKREEGGRRDCGADTLLCGTAKRRHDFKAVYPFGVWVYQAQMNDGKLSYAKRRILHEGFVGDEAGLAALLPGRQGKNDYPGVFVDNKGPKMHVHAAFTSFDYNDDGQLDFLYCTDEGGGYGILIESSYGLVHPSVTDLLTGGRNEQAPEYEYKAVPGASPQFCSGAMAIRTRQGRTDLWNPALRMVLAPTSAGPALFRETTFGGLNFDAIDVRQIERNGDGLPDLAFRREGTEELEFWLNTGTGFVEGHAVGFQPAETLIHCDYKYLRDAVITDIDGNGMDDLVIPSCTEGEKGSPGSLNIQYMHPGGERKEEVLHYLGWHGKPHPERSPYGVWPGDFDGDGDVDILRVSARWTDPWNYEIQRMDNTSFSPNKSWSLLTRISSTPVAGTRGSETLISYVAGNGYRREQTASLDTSCDPAFTLEEVPAPVAGQAGPAPERDGPRAAVYSRTGTAGGCGLGSLAVCAPRLPFPVVASYVERTAQLGADDDAWAGCNKTQMFYENGKTDSHLGFVGFERVSRHHLVPGARRATETSVFDLGVVPLATRYWLRANEEEGKPGPSVVARVYARPFAGYASTTWTDEVMPSGARRTTILDLSRALLQRDVEPGPTVTYAASRLPKLRAISNRHGEFWGQSPALMVVPVLRQGQAVEGGKRLQTTATWWLRNGGGFVDNEVSFTSQTSDVGDLLNANGDFSSQASPRASGDVDHDKLASWFGRGHDASAVRARLLRQASTTWVLPTWETRIGWLPLQGSEVTTGWARPLEDGRQDARRVSQQFGYDGKGALLSTTQADGYGATHTRTITKRASTGVITGVTESAADAWNGPMDTKSWTFDVDEYGLYAVAATNPKGHVHATRYDYASGQPVQTRDADGVVTRARYDAFGRLAFDTVEGAETSVSYAWQKVSPVEVELTNNPSGVDKVWVNASYRVVETTTRGGDAGAFVEVSAETWLDPVGRVVRSGQRGPLGEMVWTESVYDPRGRLVTQTRPHTDAAKSTQGAVVYTHDSLDRATKVTRPNDTLSGNLWVAMQYGSVGDPGELAPWLSGTVGGVRGTRQTTSDAQRTALVRTFDAEGRLVSALEHHDREAEAPVTKYVPGLDAPMAITGPDGATLRTNFDLLGRPVHTVDPSSGTVTSRYDGFGRLREQRDNDTLHRFEYDLLDRPVMHTRTYAGQDGAFGPDKVTTWEWDSLPESGPKPEDHGKLLRISNDAGHTETYTYGGPFALPDSVTRTVPRPGASALSLETRYEYDGDGRVRALLYPAGGLSSQRAQSYRYNARGALTGIDATMGGVTRAIWELDEVYEGRLPSEAKLLEGTESHAYYPGTSAVKRLSVTAGTGILVDQHLLYNESGLLARVADLALGTAHSFLYDRFRRLKEKQQGTSGAGAVLESFAYSKGGRIEQKDGASLSYAVRGESAQWPDAVKRLERDRDAVDYGYHPTYGLMTSMRGTWHGTTAGLDVAYDVDREVRQVTWDTGTTRSLGLAASGERASMHETGGTVDTFTAYAGPHYERADTGPNSVHLFRFTGGDGRVILEERVEQQVLGDGSTVEQSVGWQHLARDYSGSVAAILPEGGEVTRRTYEAFGAATEGAGGTDLGYTGHRHLQIAGSPLGLIDMGGRMYDPLSAQFTRADPFMPNADTPKGFNRRAYVQGDPINRVDPTGFGDDCNPATGCRSTPPPPVTPPPDVGDQGTCNGRCAKRMLQKFGHETKQFFKDISGVQAVRNKRAKERANRRYKAGLFEPEGGGAAPNTASGVLSQVGNAVDKYHLTALNSVVESITGAGDLLTFGGSQWARERIFGTGAIRTDTAASYVGAGAGFAIGGGVQALLALPSAVRALPGVVRALPGAIRGAPGAIRMAGQSAAGFLLRHIGISGIGRGMNSSNALSGVERASTSLLESVGSKRSVQIAAEGSDELRYLNSIGAEANVGGANMDSILLRPDPSKAAVLEEFLHGTQHQLGIIARRGVAGAEWHVKDFMIRHSRMLGLGAEDVARLKTLRDMGL